MSTVDPKVASLVAHMPEIHAAVLLERDRVKVIADGLFAPHNHPGRHEIFTADEKIDALVGIEGPTFTSVMSMEFGHWTKGHKKHVEGLHILSRAVAEAQL